MDVQKKTSVSQDKYLLAEAMRNAVRHKKRVQNGGSIHSRGASKPR